MMSSASGFEYWNSRTSRLTPSPPFVESSGKGKYGHSFFVQSSTAKYTSSSGTVELPPRYDGKTYWPMMGLYHDSGHEGGRWRRSLPTFERAPQLAMSG